MKIEILLGFTDNYVIY